MWCDTGFERIICMNKVNYLQLYIIILMKHYPVQEICGPILINTSYITVKTPIKKAKMIWLASTIHKGMIRWHGEANKNQGFNNISLRNWYEGKLCSNVFCFNTGDGSCPVLYCFQLTLKKRKQTSVTHHFEQYIFLMNIVEGAV